MENRLYVKIMKLFPALLTLWVLIIGCFEPDFYKYSQREDLYRLPLIKPYELLNIASEDKSVSRDFWTLKLKQLEPEGNQVQVSLTDVNISQNIIYGYAENRPWSGSQTYIAIVRDTDNEFKFKNKEEWLKFLSQRGIDGTKTLNVWKVFSQYREGYKLPWKIN
jgi:hypothetical protein